MAKLGRPKLGEGVTRFTVSATKEDRDFLSIEAERKGESLARFVIRRALIKEFPKKITKQDLELFLQIADRCGGEIETSVMFSILSKQNEP